MPGLRQAPAQQSQQTLGTEPAHDSDQQQPEQCALDCADQGFECDIDASAAAVGVEVETRMLQARIVADAAAVVLCNRLFAEKVQREWCRVGFLALRAQGSGDRVEQAQHLGGVDGLTVIIAARLRIEMHRIQQADDDIEQQYDHGRLTGPAVGYASPRHHQVFVLTRVPDACCDQDQQQIHQRIRP